MINKQELKEAIKKEGWTFVPFTNGKFSVEPRPHYCDRGNWIVKIFPDGEQTDLYIDGADMFPRYYFDFDCMVKELEMWMAKNKQILKPYLQKK